MNRIAMHVSVILLTGVIIGLIVRSQRRQFAQQSARQHAQQVDATDASKSDADPNASIGAGQSERTPIMVQGEGWLSEFELTQRDGQTVSSKDLLGQPYVVSFFFTTCVSTCPMQNEKLKILQEEFYGKPVRFLSISVDPEIDTPEVLTQYAKRFEADPKQWLFLTGDLTYIRRVGTEIFRLPIRRRFHTDRFILVDATGEIVGVYEWPEPSQFNQLKTDISKILQNGSLAADKTPASASVADNSNERTP